MCHCHTFLFVFCAFLHASAALRRLIRHCPLTRVVGQALYTTCGNLECGWGLSHAETPQEVFCGVQSRPVLVHMMWRSDFCAAM